MTLDRFFYFYFSFRAWRNSGSWALLVAMRSTNNLRITIDVNYCLASKIISGKMITQLLMFCILYLLVFEHLTLVDVMVRLVAEHRVPTHLLSNASMHFTIIISINFNIKLLLSFNSSIPILCNFTLISSTSINL